MRNSAMRNSAITHYPTDITETDVSVMPSRYHVRGLDGWWTQGPTMPDLPLEVAAGSHWLQIPTEGGDKYAALLPWVKPVARKRRTRPDAPVDALGAFPLLSPARDPSRPPAGAESAWLQAGNDPKWYGEGPTVELKAKPSPVRGPEAIIERLKRKGIVVSLSPSRSRLLVTWPQGRVNSPESVTLFTVAGPLLIAYLAGKPLTCDATAHAEPVEAVTILVPDLPACAACAGLPVAEPKKPGILARLRQ